MGGRSRCTAPTPLSLHFDLIKCKKSEKCDFGTEKSPNFVIKPPEKVPNFVISGSSIFRKNLEIVHFHYLKNLEIVFWMLLLNGKQIKITSR